MAAADTVSDFEKLGEPTRRRAAQTPPARVQCTARRVCSPRPFPTTTLTFDCELEIVDHALYFSPYRLHLAP